MNNPARAELTAAHDEIVGIIRRIPDQALDLDSGNGEWSIRQTLSHLAHANDFYEMIVEEARASGFETLRLPPDLPGWQRMSATDAAVARCASTGEILDCFEQTYQRLVSILDSLTPEELDQLFVFYSQRPDVPPYTTTLRERVIQQSASHLREHIDQLLTRD